MFIIKYFTNGTVFKECMLNGDYHLRTTFMHQMALIKQGGMFSLMLFNVNIDKQSARLH